MDIDDVDDVPRLVPELLQHPDVSLFGLKVQIAENLFSQWLSLPDTCRLVLFVLISH